MGIRNQRINQSFKPKYPHAKVGSIFWADDLLRYQIGSLQGEYFGSRWLDRIILARESQKWFRYYGYDWHSKRVGNWISRCFRDHGEEIKQQKQPRKADSRAERERESLNNPQKRVIKFIGDLYT